MEDEPELLGIYSVFLSRYFEVREASSVEAALGQINHAQERFDVLLSDIGLGADSPLGGVEVAIAFRKRLPKAAIILMSAATDWQVRLGHFQPRAHFRFLAKPFELKNLIATIEELNVL